MDNNAGGGHHTQAEVDRIRSFTEEYHKEDRKAESFSDEVVLT